MIDCPYVWCRAVVELNAAAPNPQFPGEPKKYIIGSHAIEFEHLEGRPCPTSYMYFPLDEDSQNTLREMGNRDSKLFYEGEFGLGQDPVVLAQQKVKRRIKKLHDEGECGGKCIYCNPPESQSLRGPHRIGREPADPRSEDWALMGREDEDIQPNAVWHDPPKGIHGEGVGKVSMEETVSAINSGAISIGEAQAAMNGMGDKLRAAYASVENARNAVQYAKGEIESQTLNEYIALCLIVEEDLQRCLQNVEDTMAKLPRILSLGEEYQGRIMG